MIRDAIILGAGAAGLMCAMTAGRRGFSCAVIYPGENMTMNIIKSLH